MGRNSAALLAVLATLAAGCGGDEDDAETSSRRAPAVLGRCQPAASVHFRLCGQPGPGAPDVPSTIQRRDGVEWRAIAGPPERSIVDGIPIGHWAGAWLSPDGETLLAQWSAECEIPIAFFVDAQTGKKRPVTGEKDWADAPESIALGWSSDGRARVRLTKGYCGGAKHPPGVYLIDPTTGRLSLVRREEARG
jgi:hypothetical protein